MNPLKFAAAMLAAWSGIVAAGPLADVPLTLKGSVPPNVLFSVSVEYPTANTAAYQGANDYSAALTYLGIFDPKKCYDYGNGMFLPQSLTTDHTCSGTWSGNFLNWATMTGLDEFRHAMTGGNRFIDTDTETVLERTYQDGQGGTSNFPNKTFSGSGATPYSNVTITNQGKGVTMVVATSGGDVANCTNPSLSGGTFSCAFTQQSNGGNLTCASWSGNGSTTSPYACTSFNPSGSGQVFSGVTPGTKSSASAGDTTTVSCVNPSFNGTTFACDLVAAGGNSGSCITWSGSGLSATDPFTCTAFGSFSGGAVFSGSGTSTASFVRASGNQPQTDEKPPCTFTSTPSKKLNCSLTTGSIVTCTNFSGNGTKNNPYVCTGAWTSSGGETGFSHGNGNKKTSGSIRYRPPSEIRYTTPATSTTYYYRSSYAGSNTAGYYYYSTYDVSLSPSQTFNVRVKVCDPNVGLESNCKPFGSSYKPTGVVQDNGDRMRFGVLSYYNSRDIDNAVMRSKLKYVAPQKYASGGGTVANPNKEWDANGKLLQSPDSAESSDWKFAAANSGVINYINKFGSTGTGNTRYKVYDNIGKLYYESLNYLRGRSPTSAYHANATAANSDNFPVITNWGDPIEYSCQKNYVIAMGDMNTWCDKRLPGGLFTDTLNGVCNAQNGQADDRGGLSGDSGVGVGDWTNKIGTLEGKTSLATTGAGVGNASYYMSGLAYWARRNDIRPDDPTKSQTAGVQTVKTFVIDVQEYKRTGVPGANNGSSQFWYAAKYGGADSFDSSGAPLNWSKPRTVFGTSHADWPNTLLPAGDPASMISSVKEAIEDIAAVVGNEAALAQSSGDLRIGVGSFIYRSIFNTKDWSGDVQAFKIDTDGKISEAPTWLASSNRPAPVDRRILTFNDGRNADGTVDTADTNKRRGVVFDYANLSLLQKATLDADALGNVDGLGEERVNYLRGDTSNEAKPPTGLGWRTRTSKLGDFINSSPAYVARPLALFPTDGYYAFAKTIKDRRPMLYVGGNDGMLHGFDASAAATTGITPGKELIAFVPSAVYPNLSRLTASNYSHKYFVDASPVASEACFGTSGCTTWKTLLVGGLNAGGRGIYALDVTNPANFGTATASDLVLWEFTARDDPDLGYTFGKPVIRKMNNGRWAVIFGNGFHNTTPDSNAGVSATGRAYLYILYVDGPGAGNAWVQGTHYHKIELKAPSEGATPTLPLNPANGLASPAAIDNDLDGKIDVIYAGDRHGNVWKFDVSSSSPASWGVAFGTASSPLPLFSATDDLGNAQPITTGMEVSRHPLGGYLLLLGTGSYIETTDPLTPFKTQSYYGIWDKFDAAKTRVVRSNLQRQTVVASVNSDGDTYYIQSACRPNYSTSLATTGADPDCPSSIIVANSAQQLGWVFDLPASGERSVSEGPLLEAGVLTFTTLAPAANPCTGNTAGRMYNLSYLTGGRIERGVFDLNADGKLDASDLLTVASQITANAGGKVPPSGKELKGGWSERPIRHILLPNNSGGGGGGGGGTSPTTSCTPFVPGWGCPSLLGARRTRAVQDVNSCGNLSAGPAGCLNTTPLVLDAQQGRITWRQIMR